MYRIQFYNNIADSAKVIFCQQPHTYIIGDESNPVEDPHAILVRSKDLKTLEVNPSLRIIARAGSGINNIDVNRMTEKRVLVCNTPGANSNGVAEMVFGALIMSQRNLHDAYFQGKTTSLVDKGEWENSKGVFKGHEIKGKTLGVIGLGAIGSKVAHLGLAFGMKVLGYDTIYKGSPSFSLVDSIENLIREADVLTVHVPLTDATRGILGENLLEYDKIPSVIINFSRAEIVNEEVISCLLHDKKIKSYITDFPSALLNPNTRGVIAFPHLGASTFEAEEECARQAATQIKDFLEERVVTHTINYPFTSYPPVETN